MSEENQERVISIPASERGLTESQATSQILDLIKTNKGERAPSGREPERSQRHREDSRDPADLERLGDTSTRRPDVSPNGDGESDDPGFSQREESDAEIAARRDRARKRREEREGARDRANADNANDSDNAGSDEPREPEDEHPDQRERDPKKVAKDAPGDEGDEGDEGDLPEGMEDAGGGDVSMEVEGKQYVIPKAVALGAMRTRDYQTKTAEVADMRRHVQATDKTLQADLMAFKTLAPLIADRNNVHAAISQLEGSMPDPEEDMIAYLKHDKRLRELKSAASQLETDISEKRTGLAAQRQTAIAEQMSAGHDYLRKTIPKWNKETQSEVSEFLEGRYYRGDELSEMTDPRIIALAHDAMQYQRLKAKRPEITNKVRTANPVVRPSGQVNQAGTQRNKARDLQARARRTGSDADAQAAILALIKANASKQRSRR